MSTSASATSTAPAVTGSIEHQTRAEGECTKLPPRQLAGAQLVPHHVIERVVVAHGASP